MRIKLYLDEDVDVALARSLNNRKIDAITARDASNRGKQDHEQLSYASQQNRVILTHNRGDYVETMIFSPKINLIGASLYLCNYQLERC